MSLDHAPHTPCEEVRCPLHRPDGDSEAAVWLVATNPVRAALVSVTVAGLQRSRTWACEHFGREHVETEEERVACLTVVVPVPFVGALDIDEAHGPRTRPAMSELDFQKLERL